VRTPNPALRPGRRGSAHSRWLASRSHRTKLCRSHRTKLCRTRRPPASGARRGSTHAPAAATQGLGVPPPLSPRPRCLARREAVRMRAGPRAEPPRPAPAHVQLSVRSDMCART
jgi:hypothetical protein